ncbi:MAG: A/G-specific adenine glycosylase [Acidimicrobiales bacterium]|nr:A/G-specific adenine glycosylase [Acidimicrobiales bacterium]
MTGSAIDVRARAVQAPEEIRILAVRPIRRAILAWAAHARRDLPWRTTRDPWAVLVSELMLQQTQVSRVVPRYEAFLERFPTVRSCAEASRGEVIASWAGLGYNRRAVMLHRCAVTVVVQHDGQIPSDLGALLALPGIGPYTARAVLVFAFEHDAAVVDTNVGRVLARLAGVGLTAQLAQSLADALVPKGRSWEWNQAMLDLGATMCRARVPACEVCPVQRWCAWGSAGASGDDPATGSAGVSGPQSRFEGSDRQGRGRLIAALRERGSVSRHVLAEVAGWPDNAARAQRIADALVTDGLACWDGQCLRLPSD